MRSIVCKPRLNWRYHLSLPQEKQRTQGLRDSMILAPVMIVIVTTYVHRLRNESRPDTTVAVDINCIMPCHNP